MPRPRFEVIAAGAVAGIAGVGAGLALADVRVTTSLVALASVVTSPLAALMVGLLAASSARERQTDQLAAERDRLRLQLIAEEERLARQLDEARIAQERPALRETLDEAFTAVARRREHARQLYESRISGEEALAALRASPEAGDVSLARSKILIRFGMEHPVSREYEEATAALSRLTDAVIEDVSGDPELWRRRCAELSAATVEQLSDFARTAHTVVGSPVASD